VKAIPALIDVLSANARDASTMWSPNRRHQRYGRCWFADNTAEKQLGRPFEPWAKRQSARSQTMTLGFMQVEYPRLRIGKPLAVWKIAISLRSFVELWIFGVPSRTMREPATGIIVIDISAVLDCAGAINNLPGLIKFKR
jgi:hypothetical protein